MACACALSSLERAVGDFIALFPQCWYLHKIDPLVEAGFRGRARSAYFSGSDHLATDYIRTSRLIAGIARSWPRLSDWSRPNASPPEHGAVT
jgi:hypothetical protein